MFKKFALITILLTIIFSYCYFRYSAYCHYKEKTLPSYPVPSDGDQCERFSVSENKKIVVCLDSIGNFLNMIPLAYFNSTSIGGSHLYSFKDENISKSPPRLFKILHLLK